MVNKNPASLLKTLIIFLFLLNNIFPQPAAVLNSSQIKIALQRLNVIGSVLYIAAHPDDENTALLSYLTTEKHLRTGYLSLTRGDGGQNLIGDEQGDLLGLIRTQELLQARKIDGAQQFFTRAIDFGYTKSPDECFKFWDKEKILSDVVFVIRKFKPDIIITRFPTTGQGGHGQHTASAILALEAFKISGDSNAFPEQLKYVSAWSAKRIYWNAWTPALKSMGINPDTLAVINLGKYNSLLGKSYMEIAALSRTMHKSQGFGSAGVRGDFINYFYPLDGSDYPSNLFEGLDLSWNRIEGADKISQLLKDAEENFDPMNPSAIVPGLIEACKLVKRLNNNYWKDIKLNEIALVIKSCLGLWIEAVTDQETITPGDTLNIKTGIVNRSGTDAELIKILYPFGINSSVQNKLDNNVFIENSLTITVPKDLNYTQPYWLTKNHNSGMYESDDPELTGLPELHPQMIVKFVIEILGEQFEFETPVFYRYTDPVDGEVYHPIEIIPPVTISFENEMMLFTDLNKKQYTVTIKAQTDFANGRLLLSAENGWQLNPASFDIELMKKGEVKSFAFVLNPSVNSSVSELKASVTLGGRNYNKSFIRINYKHIPEQVYFPDAKSKLVYTDIGKSMVKKIGYLVGSGDKIPEILKQLGFDVTILDDHSFMNGDLSRFDVIITGIRAYNTVSNISVYNEKLKEYIFNGGTVINQYNTTSDLFTEPGVYPLKISRDRVTEEDSPVKILDENNQLINYPNKITSKDFDGWVQERGLYFPDEWDNRYQPILEMYDTGEKPLQGALLYATYGKGTYIYTGLSFFRQLPAGIPGAIRLFVNLISAGSHGS